ncbi:MAG TPA: hypothetical protein VJ765_15995 [Chitinophagaceae bacterium]|nr:hypothetical protein [Chitinophagaceae bacterium]
MLSRGHNYADQRNYFEVKSITLFYAWMMVIVVSLQDKLWLSSGIKQAFEKSN